MNKPGKIRGGRAAMLAAPLVLLGGCAPNEGAPVVKAEACYGVSDGACLPPGRWPGVCVVANDNQQSPVDITATRFAAIQGLTARYAQHHEITVVTNGLTLMVDLQASTDTLAVPEDKSCKLSQLHFHTPSEHKLGGTSFPIEAHLVHQCDAAENLVISVMMTYLEDQENPVLGAALDHAATDAAGFTRGTVSAADVAFSAADVLPPARLDGLFHYQGSLTTPPCTEGVAWYVLSTPATVSKAQVERLEQVLIDTSPIGFAHNNRPIQDRAGRTIERDGAGLPF
jgi:carbonic anhydrase